MDIWHRVGRIVRFSNLGTLLFFTLNILLIVAVFGSSGSIVELICIYFFTVAISLSPLGEMCLAAFAGASDIKRVDIKLRVVPLVQYVLDKAKENTSYCPKKVKVKIAHNLRLRHIACAVALHNFCKLADMKHIVSDLRMILVNEGAGLHNHFIRVVNLHTAAIGDMKQILIMAVDKSDFLTIRVVLICHLRFPPFSNSILNFVLPSSDTSIKTVASKVLPVLSDLQFLSFTLPEPSNFCAVAEVMLLPMLAK